MAWLQFAVDRALNRMHNLCDRPELCSVHFAATCNPLQLAADAAVQSPLGYNGVSAGVKQCHTFRRNHHCFHFEPVPETCWRLLCMLPLHLSFMLNLVCTTVGLAGCPLVQDWWTR